jgi:hypothetical protein
MKRRRMGLALMLGLLSVLWGGAITEGKGPHHFYFKLKMSEDKKLCPAITDVLAEEYNEHWIQDSPRQEWFI